ncbi:MAG: tetratricopeptide repeat protein [Promethearchaeota archaeon]
MNGRISAKGYFQRRNMSYRQGKYKEAIKDYRRALKIDPKGYSTWGQPGSCLRETG